MTTSRFDLETLQAAHKASSLHRASLQRSGQAGCFYCRSVYPPSLIEEWVDDGETALCPKCGIDSVIGAAAGYPIDNPDFLSAMRSLWF